MKKIYVLPVLALFLLGLLVISGTEEQTPVSDSVTFKGQVCWAVNGERIGCKENTITDVLKNDLKEMGDTGVYLEYNHIALGNTTAPAAGDTSHPGLITECGLDSTDGTYVDEGTGNWTLYHTWTSTCNNIVVNTTGVYNDTSSGHYGGGTTITSATLQSSDQLQVNFSRWVS